MSVVLENAKRLTRSVSGGDRSIAFAEVIVFEHSPSLTLRVNLRAGF
jgi:hypothetical protein